MKCLDIRNETIRELQTELKPQRLDSVFEPGNTRHFARFIYVRIEGARN